MKLLHEEKFLTYIAEGKNQVEIAKLTGLKQSSINKHFKKHGLPLPKYKYKTAPSKLDEKLFLQYVKEGKAPHEISILVKIKPRTLWCYYSRNNLIYPKGLKPSWKKGLTARTNTSIAQAVATYKITRPGIKMVPRSAEHCRNNGLARRGALKGSRHPRWKGGITTENQLIRHCTEIIEWKNSILTRDNYTCQHCTKVNGYLQAHHIKGFAAYPELRFEISNGITLCRACHKRVHDICGRSYYSSDLFIKLFMNYQIAA